MILLSRPLNLAAIVAICVSVWLSLSLLSALTQSDPPLSSPRPAYSRLQGLQGLLGKNPDACADWNPHASKEHDPPGCLRARQLRQIQDMRASKIELQPEQSQALDQLERCVLGVRKCPERPLVVSDFWYVFVRKRSNSGEAIWLDPVVDVIEDEGFVVMPYPHFYGTGENLPPAWNATRMLSESLYMYLPTTDVAFQCLSDPRCVRPQDYNPHPNSTLRHDLSLMKPHEEGRTPAWRIFITSYWGDRPSNYSGQGQSAKLQYGQSLDEESPWSSHILDNRWHIVPWSYPNHTHLPLSIEGTCLGSATVPWPQRNASVLILGKLSSYFHRERAPDFKDWSKIVAAMAAEGIELWTGATEETGKPIPEGLRRLPEMDKATYGRTLSSTRALLGIGNPQLSPSPFNSLCRGVPVVMPYYTHEGPTPGGWKTFKDRWAQNGPVLEVGEPYAYAYRGVEDMIEKLKRAVRTPIESYVPPEMTLQTVGERTRKWLYHDWEGEYREVLKRRRGKLEYPPIMMEVCRGGGHCTYPILGQPAIKVKHD